MRLSQEEDARRLAANPLMQQMPPAEHGVPTLPGQPSAQQSPLQGGSQQNGGQQ